MFSQSFQPYKLFSMLTALLFILSSNQALAEVYLSKEQAKDLPMNQAFSEFHCRDKIYGIVVERWPENSEHLLEAYWTDPHGKQREHTRYKFIARKGETRTWAWLRLHPAEPDILERLLMQEDDSLRQFDGQWKVVFYIDAKKIAKLTFQVTCG
ncbi:MAG: hypothetical protein KAJ95_10525 [Gammaproteobacteria bacterium]|nr:hypothetical protein [Gammaproteobacteria bacterium]